MTDSSQSDAPMLELFRGEAELQTSILTSGLLELERDPVNPAVLETLMRAAHSLKGAARIVNLQGVVQVAHAMEDCFVAAQQQLLILRQPQIDALLRSVDLLAQLAKRPPETISDWETDFATDVATAVDLLRDLAQDRQSQGAAVQLPATFPEPEPHPPAVSDGTSFVQHGPPERILRLGADNLNRLLGLAGESLVESRWLRPFADSLQRTKRHHADLARKLANLHQILLENSADQNATSRLREISEDLAKTSHFLSDRLQELEVFDRRSAQLSNRLYLEVLRTRMRPFADAVRRFPRMVRDLARSLGKHVRLEISGENTQVDREILERLETPLAHLLRNAVDHGAQSPAERASTGKPLENLISLEARHSAGMLLVTVADDGGGVQPETVRRAIIARGLTSPALAGQLAEPDLLDFLFVPGFTLKESVTEISGRGVGLDVVQNMVKNLRGTIRLTNLPGRGFRVQLQLPLTLSVLRALLVDVAGEAYGFPLGQVVRALKLPRAHISTLEGRPHFQFGNQHVGLVTAHQVLDCDDPFPMSDDLPVVVLGDRSVRYGLVVDGLLGQHELVVQPLDQRLGNIQDVNSAALRDDGSPVLVLDADEMIRSIERLATCGLPLKLPTQGASPPSP